MNLNNFEQTDPHLLVGLVNTELRNQADSLDDLCRTHDIDEEALKARLAQADYHFQPEQKQFR